jgi:hypothetical protein
VEAQQQRESAFVKQLKTMPIAINTGDANEQHYEVDTDFYDLCLGKNKKYRWVVCWDIRCTFPPFLKKRCCSVASGSRPYVGHGPLS